MKPVDNIRVAGSPAPLSALEAARVRLAALAERHHAAARASASGASLRDVAALLGLTLDRAACLLDRPAMRELVAFYRRAA